MATTDKRTVEEIKKDLARDDSKKEAEKND